MIFIGKILKERGNRGEVVITSPTVGFYALTERENGKKIVILKSEKHEKKFEVEFLREIKGNLILKLKGIDSINEAFKIVGYSVYTFISPDYAAGDEVKTVEFDLLEKEGETADLEGYDVKDVNGNRWGRVIYFDTDSSNHLLEIQDEDAAEVYYVPFTDTIIKKIDKETQLIIIDPPNGLKDLNKK